MYMGKDTGKKVLKTLTVKPGSIEDLLERHSFASSSPY